MPPGARSALEESAQHGDEACRLCSEGLVLRRPAWSSSLLSLIKSNMQWCFQIAGSGTNTSIGNMWSGNSKGLTGANNDATLQSQLSIHMQLLEARAGRGLDGVEIGPLLGRGSYGRVYKVLDDYERATASCATLVLAGKLSFESASCCFRATQFATCICCTPSGERICQT
jgi:hypothetical protein